MVRTSPAAFTALIMLWAANLNALGQERFIDLGEAVVVVRPGELSAAERTAGIMLVEEIEKRTGIVLPLVSAWPEGKTVIALCAGPPPSDWPESLPPRAGDDLPESRPEGLRIASTPRTPSTIWVLGENSRGALYGVGALLRRLHWGPGRLSVESGLDIASAPRSPLRGHQLGYRALANSYDAWTPAQFEQYIRELVFFGVNSIEGIPFQDADANPLMTTSRRDMNRAMSEICERYDLDYWVFAPADFDLRDDALRTEMLAKLEQLFQDCPRMDAVFFPGGDPGDNPPELALPFLEDVAKLLTPVHPQARIWLSLLGFNGTQVDWVFDYLADKQPTWFGGLTADTSGPPMVELRRRLPKEYPLRLYPDITHNKLSQFEVPWWDPAYALTLGREAINPRPMEFLEIAQWFAPCGNGFITYSDGVHDDVNKVIWSLHGWDPDLSARDMLVEYARVFFGPEIAEEAADGILALEKNWHGPLAGNGSVEGALMMWRRIEENVPRAADNWRLQMNLLRAYYDAYTRRRLLHETQLEEDAYALLAQGPVLGADAAMEAALNLLRQSDAHSCSPELLARIEALCEALFRSIGLQTSVERYHAANGERGAVLDYVNYPLNNRWWLEDEFAKIAALEEEAEKLRRLEALRTWERPGAGSFYDDIGNIAKSPHVRRRGDWNTDPEKRDIPSPTFWWWGDGMDPRARLSWQWTMEWPEAVVYEGLDPKATYTARMSGYGTLLPRFNGEAAPPPGKRIKTGEFLDFPVPGKALKDGVLEITWDRPADEEDLNWREQSRIAEIWLLKDDERTP